LLGVTLGIAYETWRTIHDESRYDPFHGR
jgi:hypothetical protein